MVQILSVLSPSTSTFRVFVFVVVDSLVIRRSTPGSRLFAFCCSNPSESHRCAGRPTAAADALGATSAPDVVAAAAAPTVFGTSFPGKRCTSAMIIVDD